MVVRFKTNIDKYDADYHFPSNLTIPPRKGEKVMVRESLLEDFTSRNLPPILEVVDVTWLEGGVICELHYRKIDVESAKLNNINLY